MELTGKDNGRKIFLDHGVLELSIELEENPTTGYLWSVAELPKKMVFNHSELIKTDQKMAGASSSRLLDFSIEAGANGKLRLHNCRPWQKDDIIETFEIELVPSKPNGH